MAVMHSVYKEEGRVSIDAVKCTGCGRCTAICAGEVLHMDGRRVEVRKDSPFGCIGCGHCMMTCPVDCITVTGRGVSHDDLVELPGQDLRATSDALENLMLARRSVRHFTQEEVSNEDLDRILEMASMAPMGIPPWDIGCCVVRGRDQVREVAEKVVGEYKKFLKILPWMLRGMCFFAKRATFEMFHDFILPLSESYVNGWKEGRDLLTYDAPALFIFHKSPYADNVDAAIACTYAMLAAESLGLGNTMLGCVAPAMARNKALCRQLGIPEGNTPAIALIVGHPDVAFKRAIRRRFLPSAKS